jgi:large subunit ribosomal protein L17
MRHLKSGRKLKRTASHRKATLSSLSVSLIQHKKIRTTVAKAKETRMVIEKLITRAKRAVQNETEGKPKNVHARRVVFSFLRDRDAVSTLFNDIAPKVGARPGGYTRVVKLGRRHGDGAEVAVIELVDYNTGQEKANKPVAAKKPRARRQKAEPSKAKADRASEKAEQPPLTPEPPESQPKG